MQLNAAGGIPGGRGRARRAALWPRAAAEAEAPPGIGAGTADGPTLWRRRCCDRRPGRCSSSGCMGWRGRRCCRGRHDGRDGRLETRWQRHRCQLRGRAHRRWQCTMKEARDSGGCSGVLPRMWRLARQPGPAAVERRRPAAPQPRELELVVVWCVRCVGGTATTYARNDSLSPGVPESMPGRLVISSELCAIRGCREGTLTVTTQRHQQVLWPPYLRRRASAARPWSS